MEFLSSALTSAVLAIPLLGVYVLFAVGIVVIYRASRVLNLAHGALALVPAYAFFSLAKLGVPLPLAVILAVAAGAPRGGLAPGAGVPPPPRHGPRAPTVRALPPCLLPPRG